MLPPHGMVEAIVPGRGPTWGPDGSTRARGKGRSVMLGCVTVFGLLLGGICGGGLGLGLLLHWLVPAIAVP